MDRSLSPFPPLTEHLSPALHLSLKQPFGHISVTPTELLQSVCVLTEKADDEPTFCENLNSPCKNQHFLTQCRYLHISSINRLCFFSGVLTLGQLAGVRAVLCGRLDSFNFLQKSLSRKSRMNHSEESSFLSKHRIIIATVVKKTFLIVTFLALKGNSTCRTSLNNAGK